MFQKFQDALPDGVSIKDAHAGFEKKESLSKIINLQEYMITTSKPVEKESIAIIPEQLIIERVKEEQSKELDIRPGLHSIELTDEFNVNLSINVGIAGTGRPEEYLMKIFGLTEGEAKTCLFHRSSQYHYQDGKKFPIMEASSVNAL
jgi:hypothetical protein